MKQAFVDLIPDPLVRLFAEPYVAGYSLAGALARADGLHAKKSLHSTVDFLGEELDCDEDVERSVARYVDIVQALRNRPHCTISLKPTQMGIHKSYEYCRDNIEKILYLADPCRIAVTLDMEDHTFTDVTLRMYRELQARHPTFGTVLQTRLLRTPADVDAMRDIPARVRLCIGIYLEPSGIALTHKSNMKRVLLDLAGRMFDYGHTVEFATHDERTIAEALDLVRRKDIPKERYEFQFLMGVPRDRIQQELIGQGIRVRLYLPFAEQWKDAAHYSKRRLSNNPNMAFYVMGNLAKKIGGKK